MDVECKIEEVCKESEDVLLSNKNDILFESSNVLNSVIENVSASNNNLTQFLYSESVHKGCDVIGRNGKDDQISISEENMDESNFTISTLADTLFDKSVTVVQTDDAGSVASLQSEVPLAKESIVVNEAVVEDNNDTNYNNCIIEYNFKHIPYQITGCWKEFISSTRNNFTRGCKWAPDGSCILTSSDDNILRIFNLPQQIWDTASWQDIQELESVVKILDGELTYDYCWYPLMNSADVSTCCLASTSRNSTVHLWDGFTGELRCSYRTYNHMDEIVTPHSLGFDADGQKLFCGFEKVVRVFNVDTPGRNFEERRIFAKKSGQMGIVSCFAFTPSNRSISAAGSYQKTIGIYSEPSGNLECILEGQSGGVTQIQFSPDGMLLYSGGRKDPEILCWDIRNLGTVLFSLRRSCQTNQRMYFDISRCGRYIVSGNHNGVITVWDTTSEAKTLKKDEFDILEPIQFFMAHEDCVNGISLHPTFPLMCSSSGQRKFPTLAENEEEIFSPKIEKRDNSLRLWWIGN